MNILLDAIGSQGGWTVAIVGILVVFISLYFLSLLFKLIPFLMNLKIRRELRKKGIHEAAEKEILTIDTDTNAAISMALFLFLAENHDEESNIITIKRLSRRYSPWSSKIYNVMNSPDKKLRN
jgi:hypothetical protein